ncbi:MAG: hypothetical protein A2133_03530 [Actinobacteria bacterium RBG_16_64_13]|nr:MAG: hypothetical protein A2133_03530 [Actinobacteria bacterium RBG_16_64_13]
MFCKTCGDRVPDGAKFCGNCGATAEVPVDQPTEEVTAVSQPSPEPPPPVLSQPPAPAQPPVEAPFVAAPAPVPPPPAFAPPGPTARPSGYSPYGPAGQGAYRPGGGPPGKSRLGLWIGIAAAVVIVVAAVLLVWLLVLDDGGGTTPTTGVVSTTSTTKPGSSTTVAPSTTTSTTSTTIGGAPGDSPGEWVEMDNSELPTGAYAVAVSDQALLIDVQVDVNTYELYAYMLGSGSLIQLPIEANDFFGEDIDGLMAVWSEGTYDESTGQYTDSHIYAYPLPDGPKAEVTAATGAVFYPQVAEPWITWVESTPLEENPDEYSLLRISGVMVDSKGVPVGEPAELVSQATAFVLGDSSWNYGLTNTHLVWENATTVGTFDPGIYSMELATLQPLIVGSESWRPSLAEDTIVYTESGLMAASVDGGQVRTIDALGDFGTAAPTFAAYYRTPDSEQATGYEVVARGYTGAYEQVLGVLTDAPPWLSAPISASANHVAFIVDGGVHLFEWQGR